MTVDDQPVTREPGWYHDPDGQYVHQAYWDGERWTGRTRLGRKDERKARERSWRRSWTVVFAVIGVVLIYWWWAGSPSELASDRLQDASSEGLLSDNGITFVYPDAWSEMFVDDPPGPVWRFVVTPDHGSNWISFAYIPRSVANEWYATPETLGVLVDSFETDSQKVVRGPVEVEYAGVSGQELSVEGIVGEQTGKALNGEVIVLYSDDVSYLLMAQYEPESRDMVLTAWETMLANLELASGG